MGGNYRSEKIFCRKKWPGPILGVQNPEQSEKMSSKYRYCLRANLSGGHEFLKPDA